jgi:hypothetical protein
MMKDYSLEVYAKNGYVVLMNECVADSVESAIAQFVAELENIHYYDPDYDEELASAIVEALKTRFTVSFSRHASEVGPADVEFDFTDITIQLDIN